MAAASASASTTVVAAPKWGQKTVTIPPHSRGCHLITSNILKEIAQDLSGIQCGLAHIFLQHTSASLTINENYDSDVRDDTETFLNRIVPEGVSAPWKHTLEGPDDMPAHLKSSMFGCDLTIPITNGKLNMGTWQRRVFVDSLRNAYSEELGKNEITIPAENVQHPEMGIWLCEHRDSAAARRIVVTLNGI